MRQVARCIITVTEFIVSGDSDALPHTGLHVFTRQRLWPSQYVDVLLHLFLSSTEQHLLGQRKPLDNTTVKNRCCCYYETDNLFVRIHRMCISLHQCSGLCRRGQISGNYMLVWAPAGYIERDLSVPLSNGTAQVITNRFPLSAVGWTNTFQLQNTILTNHLLVECVATPFI